MLCLNYNINKFTSIVIERKECPKYIVNKREAIRRNLHSIRNKALGSFENAPTSNSSLTSEEYEDMQMIYKQIKYNDTLSRISPTWLTQLGQLWGNQTEIPVANPKPKDLPQLLNGALFEPLYGWMQEYGKIYILPTGPVSSFLVISDPRLAKHILKYSDNKTISIFGKGLVAEVSQFLFGQGLVMTKGEKWKSRRKALAPAFHKNYLNVMIKKVFIPSANHLASKIENAIINDKSLDVEQLFSQMTLDVIGKAVFNYDFDSLTHDSDLIQAVYFALKEVEKRATDLIPLWKIPFMSLLVPRYRKAENAVKVIRETTETLIEQCKEMEDDGSNPEIFTEDYLNESDPSILRFLIASREQVTSTQLRDDLLSLMVAGHETTASTLTWTLYLLEQNPDKLQIAIDEVDSIIDDIENITLEQYMKLKYVNRCICESLRLYPNPPVLIRRSLEKTELPGGYNILKNQDILISVYNIHHSDDYWENAKSFIPERFGMDDHMPNEMNTDFRFIPFSGGPRKCIGDQFAMMESVVTLAVLLKKYKFKLVPNQNINITTGATIHTTSGLYMNFEYKNEISK